MDDSAPLKLDTQPSGDSRSTLLAMCVNGIYHIKYKSLVFLFLLFILITSDVFANVVLKKTSGGVDDFGSPTPYGTVVQGLTLVLCYMGINFLIDQKLI